MKPVSTAVKSTIGYFIYLHYCLQVLKNPNTLQEVCHVQYDYFIHPLTLNSHPVRLFMWRIYILGAAALTQRGWSADLKQSHQFSDKCSHLCISSHRQKEK